MNLEENNVELVVTPPEGYADDILKRSSVRMTLGVLTQLIIETKSHIFIASPFFQGIDKLAANPLTDAIQFSLERGVVIDIICTGTGIEILKQGWNSLIMDKKVKLFRPKLNIDNETLLGSHAKFLISDRKKAYIGSANLTHPGLAGNLEIGVLVQGSIVMQLTSLIEHLTDSGFLLETSK